MVGVFQPIPVIIHTAAQITSLANGSLSMLAPEHSQHEILVLLLISGSRLPRCSRTYLFTIPVSDLESALSPQLWLLLMGKGISRPPSGY